MHLSPLQPPPEPPLLLALPRGELRLGRMPALMGILNCTPDSFSDGGLHAVAADAVAAGLAMIADGATILDVGGESTRPGASPVAASDEKDRVLPVIEALRAAAPGVIISCDTTKVAVAEAALDAGADLLNDVSGMTWEPEMADLAAERGCAVVLMHLRGRPGTMMSHTAYDDVVAEVSDRLAERVAFVQSRGVRADRIVIDPGIGFAKELADNLRLIRYARHLLDGDYPVLIGPSRKRFVGQLTGVERPSDRLSGTLGAVVAAAFEGAHILRVHDVRAARDALVVATAIRDA